MPDYPWDDAKFSRRMEFMGPLEWEEAHHESRLTHFYRLRKLKGYGWIVQRLDSPGATWTDWNSITDHEVASLIREWQREKLLAAGIWLEPFVPSDDGWMIARYKSDLKTIEYYVCEGRWIENAGVGLEGYDTTQGIAIDALMSEEK